MVGKTEGWTWVLGSDSGSLSSFLCGLGQDISVCMSDYPVSKMVRIKSPHSIVVKIK